MDISKSSPHVKLAMSTINAYVRERRTICVPDDTPAELLDRCAGAFICLKIDGHLRGCIGTIEPMHDCLAKEIIENSISAATKDPRFMPVDIREVALIECSVDVLSEPEMVNDLRDLDPARYGVIVECGSKRGLLLPDLEGVDTVEEQIGIARHKANIYEHESIKLYRFEVNRYH
ncbi:MAG: AmmeMemoRadiSam system protein A [Armatimonadetes bacterium]|nr:AmmeMemoRadiSam system protein A [Armatimonadota bacterium]